MLTKPIKQQLRLQVVKLSTSDIAKDAATPSLLKEPSRRISPSHHHECDILSTPNTPKHYLLFHLTRPTHPTKALTSSLPANFSTLSHSLANSSLLAHLCTKLWHARHNHATLFSSHSSCQPRFSTFAWVDRGIRWW